MNPTMAKLVRRLIRFQLVRTSPEKLLKLAEKKVLAAFRRAAQFSPAYQILLNENATEIGNITTVAEFTEHCPILEKTNTFKRFSVDQLMASDIQLDQLASVLTSSGHGANGFALGLSTRKQLKSAAAEIDFGLELAFDIDRYSTLLINCLPMGVTFQSEAVCVANVSVREDMACAIIAQAGSSFQQIILCGDPIFLKKLCDFSIGKGIDWQRYRVNVIVGEETFSETFRDYLATVLKIPMDQMDNGIIGSSMGIGELGLNLFNETKETIMLRRTCAANPALLQALMGTDAIHKPLPTFMVFNPLRSYVEVVATDENGSGDLLVSMLDKQIPIPLMRYKTGDRAKLLQHTDILAAGKLFAHRLTLPNLPIIALHGRVKDYLPDGTHLDVFKHALYYDKDVATHVSGAFRLSTSEGSLHWAVQLQTGDETNPEHVAMKLKESMGLLFPQIEVGCYSYTDFPHGKSLDYERKFIYWPS